MIENSYLVSQSQMDMGDQSQANADEDSVYFARIHDSSDVKRLADELRDLVAGKGYDKFTEEKEKRRVFGGLYSSIDQKKYNRLWKGSTTEHHRTPMTALSTIMGFEKKDPELGPYELVPQTDMFFKESSGRIKFRRKRSSLRNSDADNINPFENQELYPGKVIDLMNAEASRMASADTMQSVLDYTRMTPEPVRPPPVAPVYDVLVTDKDGVIKRQPTVPVTAIRETPIMMIPSPRAIAPVTATVKEPVYTGKQVVVENRPVGPALPLRASNVGRPAYAPVPLDNKEYPKGLIPARPISLTTNPVPMQANGYGPPNGMPNPIQGAPAPQVVYQAAGPLSRLFLSTRPDKSPVCPCDGACNWTEPVHAGTCLRATAVCKDSNYSARCRPPCMANATSSASSKRRRH